MTDIEQRAHDFAIAAVNAYQVVENTKHSVNGSKPHYEVRELLGIYLEAYDYLEVELSEKQYQSKL